MPREEMSLFISVYLSIYQFKLKLKILGSKASCCLFKYYTVM